MENSDVQTSLLHSIQGFLLQSCLTMILVTRAVPPWFVALVMAAVVFTVYQLLYVPLVLSPLNRVPGPKSFATIR